MTDTYITYHGSDGQVFKLLNAFDKQISEGLYPHMDFSQTTYINKDTPLKVRCTKHNQTFFATLASIRNGKRIGCRECTNEANRNAVADMYKEICLGDGKWNPLDRYQDSVTAINHECLCCGDVRKFKPLTKASKHPVCQREIGDRSSQTWMNNVESNSPFFTSTAEDLKKKMRKTKKKAFKLFLKDNTNIKLTSKYINQNTVSSFHCKDCNTPFKRRCADLQDRVKRKGNKGCSNCDAKIGAERQIQSGVDDMHKQLENDNIKIDRILKSYTDSANFTFPCGCTHYLTHSNMRRGYNSQCPTCCNDKPTVYNRPNTLYYIEIYGRYKIGITVSGSVVGASRGHRYCIPQDVQNIRIVKQWDDLGRGEARKMERNIINEFAWAKYDGDTLFADGTGNTEVFTHDVLGLDNE